MAEWHEEQQGGVMNPKTLEERVTAVERELSEISKIFMSGAGEIITLPDDAPPEKQLEVIKRFARRILSIGKFVNRE